MKIGSVIFTASKEEMKAIGKTADRAISFYGPHKIDRQSLVMDIEAVHCNGCPLRLAEMADWNRDFDVMHDVSGIINTLDRKTGKIVGLFNPRFAVRQ